MKIAWRQSVKYHLSPYCSMGHGIGSWWLLLRSFPQLQFALELPLAESVHCPLQSPFVFPTTLLMWQSLRRPLAPMCILWVFALVPALWSCHHTSSQWHATIDHEICHQILPIWLGCFILIEEHQVAFLKVLNIMLSYFVIFLDFLYKDQFIQPFHVYSSSNWTTRFSFSKLALNDRQTYIAFSLTFWHYGQETYLAVVPNTCPLNV